ncbi:PTS system, beta-glucoside-specific IIABC subunit [Clostridium sp. DL-VIII]|uniref:beta-glucoside-specific PTS transporter subunit IIABC n=1 Tax=Clostridium sp. DL-VIII TaxID=641107 RepID=UPI00023B003B|nr:beta-glucoside-specific PTS transporter subunit IIABC [Clostridium sp. DL-VIII]EHI99163.1 PTS system, beta-glucoside-specific IIABC subunit [Clostridium sp. DL-VIII]
MDYSVIAKKILDKVGGEKNIISVTHCMTRLRFVLKNEEMVSDDQIKAIKGVAGVMKKAGQYQIIIGNDVAKCYQELLKLGNFKDSSNGNPLNKPKQNPVMAILDVISGCMAPIIPAIIGAGMIKVLIIIMGFFVPDTNQTMQLLTVMGDCAFYFMPVLIAYSAGKKFNTNPYMVAAVAGVLLHPNFIALLNNATGGVYFLGIPVTSASYSSTIIPIILTAWGMSYIEKLVEKITPSVTKNFLKPALILLISAPVAFIILGPLGSLIGNGLAVVVLGIQNHASVVAMIIMASAMPFIVMTGMHWAFIPVTMAALATPVGESLMLPAMLISNLAQGSACMAVALKSKNSNMKQIASASGFSALLAGVTEPGLYGVSIPLKRPMAAICIASGITGAFAGFVRLAAHAFATPSIVSLPQFLSPEKSNNIVMAFVTAGIAIVLSFVLTWFMGFEDPVEVEENDKTEDLREQTDAKKKKLDTENLIEGNTIYSPVSGKTIPLSQVNDATFSTEMIGKGFAIIPSEGKVYAPFDGEVAAIFATKHALGLKSDNGIELLIHVGLETVSLNGKHFTAHVKNEQKIKRGDLMLEFDLEAITEDGYETVTPVIVSNTADYSEIISLTDKDVKALEPVMKVM